MARDRFINNLAARCINLGSEVVLIKDDKHTPVSPVFFSMTPELQRFEEGCRKLFKVNPKHRHRH